MENMRNSCSIPLLGIVLLFPLAACQTQPVPTAVIHDDPSRFVRLEVDRVVGVTHSHPVDITADDMIAVLSGVMIEEPPGIMPAVSLFTKDKEPRNHSAFNETEIRFFAPLLAKGLATAKAEEVVTFGQTSEKTTITNKVTSGGMFVDGDELHLMLSNYRSETNYSPDPGVSGTTLDGRSAPLRSIAPQWTTLYFEPTAALAPSRDGMLSRLFRPDRRELVILFKKLSRTTSSMGPDLH